jgi:hypothetical protein
MNVMEAIYLERVAPCDGGEVRLILPTNNSSCSNGKPEYKNSKSVESSNWKTFLIKRKTRTDNSKAR